MVAFALHLLFETFGEGLVTPDGSISIVVALLGAATMVTRLVVIFGVPLFVGAVLGLSCFDFAMARFQKARRLETK